MEYTANAQIKDAVQRAHEARGDVFKSFWVALFGGRKSVTMTAQVSRWA